MKLRMTLFAMLMIGLQTGCDYATANAVSNTAYYAANIVDDVAYYAWRYVYWL